MTGAPDARGQGLARAIVAGALWSLSSNGLVQLVVLATNVVVARQLEPEAYGLMALVNSTLALAAALQGLGFAPAVAAGRLTGEVALSTAHWMHALSGAALALLATACGPLLAAYFGNAALPPLLAFSSLGLLLSSASVVPQALLQREGRFARLGVTAVGAQLLAAGCAVGLALAGAGAWALVVPGVVAAGGTLLATWPGGAERPRLRWEYASVRPFLSEGVNAAGFTFLNYFSRNADNVIVGKAFGEVALGYYSFAYSLFMRPLGILSHSLSRVLLPSFGKLGADEARTDRAFVRAVAGVLRLGSPLMVGGALTAHLLVPLVFGERWAPAVPLLQVLMLVGTLQLVGSLFGSLVLGLGRTRLLLQWGVFSSAVTVAAFLAGAALGSPLWMARAYLAATGLLVAAMYAIVRRLLGLPLDGLGRRLWGTVRDVALLALSVLAADRALSAAHVGPGLRLLAAACGGGLVYLAAFRALSAPELGELLQALPRRVSDRLTALLRLAPGGGRDGREGGPQP
jgi:PST family polysaccharide transporter